LVKPVQVVEQTNLTPFTEIVLIDADSNKTLTIKENLSTPNRSTPH
jgi:hypothetical protein